MTFLDAFTFLIRSFYYFMLLKTSFLLISIDLNIFKSFLIYLKFIN